MSVGRARIAEAKADWHAGRMKLPDLDNAEFTPAAARSANRRGTDVVIWFYRSRQEC